jgi:hypothetical protein
MGKIIDITGQTFARLRVLYFAGVRNNKARWVCVCACGNQIETQGKQLRTNHTRSCGCFQRDRSAEAHLLHGHARRCKSTTAKRAYSREYQAWLNIKRRVIDDGPKNFPYYKARGIIICSRWENSFKTFLADMGTCPPKFEIDRIDGSKGYEPGNCRWVDEITQSRNQRPRRKGYHKKKKGMVI